MNALKRCSKEVHRYLGCMEFIFECSNLSYENYKVLTQNFLLYKYLFFVKSWLVQTLLDIVFTSDVLQKFQ